MELRAYISGLNGFPDADWKLSAYLSFKGRGTKVIVFEFIENVPVSREIILVTGIEDTYTYLAKLGVHPRRTLNIPEELMKYAGRNIEYMKMGEFKKDSRLPIFVKPNGRNKEFDSGVITKESSRSHFFYNYSDDIDVLVSEVIDIVSEYRCYVIEGELVGIKHYRGDIRIFPNVTMIDSMITDYVNAPAGYSVDVGITKDGQTILIECQDGWALGNYGLENDLYTKLISRRWMQLLREGR